MSSGLQNLYCTCEDGPVLSNKYDSKMSAPHCQPVLGNKDDPETSAPHCQCTREGDSVLGNKDDSKTSIDDCISYCNFLKKLPEGVSVYCECEHCQSREKQHELQSRHDWEGWSRHREQLQHRELRHPKEQHEPSGTRAKMENIVQLSAAHRLGSMC